jgi:hypothetical protein
MSPDTSVMSVAEETKFDADLSLIKKIDKVTEMMVDFLNA